MSEPKPFASLGPTLLARKGGAKPAMRPQLGSMATGSSSPSLTPAQAPSTYPPAADLDDLGWNDMGEEAGSDQSPEEVHRPKLADVVPLAPPSAKAQPQSAPLQPKMREPEQGSEPEVKRQQRQIADALDEVEPARRAAVRRAASDQGRRAAFTLRLDAKRHLKLRLASTLKNRSAQQLVTQALDKYLTELPEIAALADQFRRDGNRS